MPRNSIIIFILFLIFFATAALGVFYLAIRGSVGISAKMARVTIDGKTFGADVASSSLDKAIGLSGRESLGDGRGMLFLFDSASMYGFWMKGMKFPIDIIWIKTNPFSGDSSVAAGGASSGRVVGFSENAVPEPGKQLWNLKIYYPPEPADRVLEVDAGTVKKYGIKAGDEVVVSYNLDSR